MDYTPYANEIRYLLLLAGVDMEKPMDALGAAKFNEILNDVERTVTVFQIGRSMAQKSSAPIYCQKCREEVTRLEYLRSYYIAHVKPDTKLMKRRREAARKQDALKKRKHRIHHL